MSGLLGYSTLPLLIGLWVLENLALAGLGIRLVRLRVSDPRRRARWYVLIGVAYFALNAVVGWAVAVVFLVLLLIAGFVGAARAYWITLLVALIPGVGVSFLLLASPARQEAYSLLDERRFFRSAALDPALYFDRTESLILDGRGYAVPVPAGFICSLMPEGSRGKATLLFEREADGRLFMICLNRGSGGKRPEPLLAIIRHRYAQPRSIRNDAVLTAYNELIAPTGNDPDMESEMEQNSLSLVLGRTLLSLGSGADYSHMNVLTGGLDLGDGCERWVSVFYESADGEWRLPVTWLNWFVDVNVGSG